jgi:hypothetical protein
MSKDEKTKRELRERN